MYVYFDKNGTIKEVVNDLAIRRGSVEANKIYVYVEDTEIDDIWFVARKPDGTLTTEQSFKTNTIEKSIPYDAKRDMKYFKDFEVYNFYVYTLTGSELSESGLMIATIRIVQDNEIFALGELTFNIQANVIKDDNVITQSQYDYLLLKFSTVYTQTEIDTLLNAKADKSTTYTKTEVDTLLNAKANQSTTYTKSETDTLLDAKANQSTTYTKTETDTLLSDKADLTNTNQTISVSRIRYKTSTFANTGSSFLEEFSGDSTGNESYMYKKFTIPEITDSNGTAYGWTTLQKAFFQFNDDTREVSQNNTTGLGMGIKTTNGVKPDVQIIPAFRYASNYSYYATAPLDPLVIIRPSLLISPYGAIYPLGLNSSHFGFYNDPTDNTKKAFRAVVGSTTLKVETTGAYINSKEIATKDDVKANPTLTGTEADLTGIEVNGVKYAVSQPVYLHNLRIYDSLYDFYATIYTTSNTAFTKTSLASYLWNNGNDLVLNCSGLYGTGKIATVIRADSQIEFYIRGYDITNDRLWDVIVDSTFYISDKVKKV